MSNIKDKYRIIHDPKDKSKWLVGLTEDSGEWAGILYTYGKFHIKEPTTPDGNATFSFERDIFYVPEHLRDKEFPSEKEVEFTTLLGSILYDILQDNLDKVSQNGDRLVLELEADDK